MKSRKIPGSELELTVVGMGCWAIGRKWWGDDVRDENSIAAIRQARDSGINWFDTAPLYGYGHADRMLVKALGPELSKVVIATKVGVRWDGDGEHAQSDLRPEHVQSDVEASLRRLGVERLDLAQLHWPCELGTPLEQTLEALIRLREEGKIRYFGLCNYNAEGTRLALKHAKGQGLVSLQTPYSLIRREFEHELKAVCAPNADSVQDSKTATEGLGVLAYEALARGLLSGKFTSSPRFPESDLRHRDERFRGLRFGRAAAFVRTLSQVAKKLQVPTSALAIAWVASRPGVSAALAGAKTAEQVRENAIAAELVDQAQLWEALKPVVERYRG